MKANRRVGEPISKSLLARSANIRQTMDSKLGLDSLGAASQTLSYPVLYSTYQCHSPLVGAICTSCCLLRLQIDN